MEKQGVNEEIWKSIKTKVYGHYLAAKSLPEYCQSCGKTLEPTDLGYDPYSQVRLWVTYCCGVMDKYEEKINEL
jgi:hypothetical protein